MPPPPPLCNGPTLMDLGALQGQQQYGQHSLQFSAVRWIICYRCSKQIYMKKDCKVWLHGPQQQQPRQNWGQQPQFSWVQQPPQFLPQPRFYGYPPTLNHIYVPPMFQSSNDAVPQQSPLQQPEAQMLPPLSLDQNGGSYCMASY